MQKECILPNVRHKIQPWVLWQCWVVPGCGHPGLLSRWGSSGAGHPLKPPSALSSVVPQVALSGVGRLLRVPKAEVRSEQGSTSRVPTSACHPLPT